jgi:hypothetical protein
MLHRAPSNDKNKADQYLDDISENFFFDVSSGIYKPKTYYKKQNRTRLQKIGHILFVTYRDAKKYWLPIIISTATLVVVIRYTNYTGTQVQTANTMTALTQLNFRRQTRPFVGIVGNVAFVSGTNAKWTVLANVKNYGVTPARRVVAIAHMLKAREGWHMEESCRASMIKSNNWSTADADAIFPGDVIPMKIDTDQLTTISSPPQPYLSVCVSYQDIETGFRFKWNTGEKVCMTYDTQTLYNVTPKNGPKFELIDTSVETAQPTLGNNEPCHGN